MAADARQSPLHPRLPSLPGSLGALGWLCAGPLVATLLVGRTGLVPSLRWLATAVGVWLLLASIALACGQGRNLPTRLARGAPALAAVASLVPFLPVLYVHDPSYHLTVTGPSAPAPVLAGHALLLAIVGAALMGGPRREPAVPLPPKSADTATYSPSVSPVVWVVLAMVGAGTLLNRGVFETLAATANTGPPVLLLANLASLAVAAWLAARATAAGSPGAVLLFTAWLWFAPLQTALAAGLPGPLLALAALCLFGLAGRHWPWISPGFPFLWLGLGLANLGPPLWGSPSVLNGSFQALFSRLFSGPGALTANDPSLPIPAVQALTAGTLLCGAALAGWWVLRTHPWRSARAIAAACFLLDASLALAPTTPRWLTSLAALSLVSLLRPSLWRALDGRRRVAVAALSIVGYALAGTSADMFLRAAAEWLSRWPALATLPALGLVLLALGQALVLDAPLKSPAPPSAPAGTPPPAPHTPPRSGGTDPAQ